MTKKAQRRKMVRTFRQNGFPFIYAVKLAKLYVREGGLFFWDVEKLFPEMNVKSLSRCECCGPIGTTFEDEFVKFDIEWGIEAFCQVKKKPKSKKKETPEIQSVDIPSNFEASFF